MWLPWKQLLVQYRWQQQGRRNVVRVPRSRQRENMGSSLSPPLKTQKQTSWWPHFKVCLTKAEPEETVVPLLLCRWLNLKHFPYHSYCCLWCCFVCGVWGLLLWFWGFFFFFLLSHSLTYLWAQGGQVHNTCACTLLDRKLLLSLDRASKEAPQPTSALMQVS